MTTIRLNAESKYGFHGQYIARITGRAPKVQFAREFVGNRHGKRNEGSSYETDEVGLYEECDVDKNGKKKSYVLVLSYKDVLHKLYTDTDDALAIAKRLDAGETLETFVEFVRGEPLSDTNYMATCSVCGNTDLVEHRCPQHPDDFCSTVATKTPRLNDQGEQRYELTYVIRTKVEATQAIAATTLDTAVADAFTVLQALPAALQRKALTALRTKLFPKDETPAIVA